ncbi:uncharacterized protein TRUGW13939_03911 [Talaromyces rugulosus]|uniref:FHA domain-containing protein n=1 Tax=Talaromyces rugulosus TaxID=121627 RepID=A0A7H8QS40_TALRU|nr:uncharacterized protein TRUGW13939_03911 [Talaromyces rugulosus]QKX56804.1 hypothetical protein TRUGW13939_03911 [Talaromyces rugulosus]
MSPSPDRDSRERPQRSSRQRSPDHRQHERRRHDRSRERPRTHDDTRRRRSPRRSSHRDGQHGDEERDEQPRRRTERSGSIEGARSSRRHRSRERDDEHRRRRHRDHHRQHDGDRDRDSTQRDHRPGSRSRDRRERRSRSPQAAPVRSRGPLPSQNDAFQSTDEPKDGTPVVEKEKPNFTNTGRLAAESNTVTVNGGSVVLKYHEPAEARKPPAKDDWRLYVFKGDDLLEMVGLNERSCWLIGREKMVVDFSIEHPSCSKQHAAIQFRYLEKKNEFGDKTGRVRPYLIDLESANGSMVNGDAVPGGRYIELRDKDVLKFGQSSREYVLMLSTE